MGASLPAEVTKEHTRILRVMLASEDCVAYWKVPAASISGSERVRVAFDQRWFGSKSESRVKTLLGDMALRFDAYPSALEALRIWNPAREIAPWLCHFHTQLADPIYRRFTGELMPKRRALGYGSIDREVVARWVQELWPGRWSPSTCLKFGGNMLATAFEAGLLKERKDPRKLITPRVPRAALEYLLYLLREVSFEGGILGSAYLRALASDSEAPDVLFRGLEAVRLQGSGDVQHFEWTYPSLIAWAEVQSGTATASSPASARGSALKGATA